jgi:hypothetical protein
MWIRPVSFKNVILPMFSSDEVLCMASHGVHLDNYEWMKIPENALNVYYHLTGVREPRMPLNGPYWSDVQIAKFKAWIDSRFLP